MHFLPPFFAAALQKRGKNREMALGFDPCPDSHAPKSTPSVIPHPTVDFFFYFKIIAIINSWAVHLKYDSGQNEI